MLSRNCNVVKPMSGKYIKYGMGRSRQSSFFSVRTTAGQERNVANFIAARVEMDEELKRGIKAILVPEPLKGYVYIEAEGPHYVEEAIRGVKHLRSRAPGIIEFSEVERHVVARPVIDELHEDDVVEVISGPFKGMRARITRVDRAKEEVVLELLEATFTLPITVHADYVRLVEKAKKGELGEREEGRGAPR